MKDNNVQPYTPKQQRMLAFLAAYLELSTGELEQRIVSMELDDLEGVLGMYAESKEAVDLPKAKPKLVTVADLPVVGVKND